MEGLNIEQDQVKLINYDSSLFSEFDTLISDKEVMKYVDGVIRKDIAHDIFSSILDGTIPAWSIRKGAEYLGHAAFNTDDDNLELIIYLKKDCWNKGIGFEVGKLLIEKYKKNFDSKKLIATLDTENLASQKLCKKLGFSFESKETDDQGQYLLYSYPKNKKDYFAGNSSAELLWKEFTNSLEYPIEKDIEIETSYAGVKEITDELLSLYISGKKYAGSSLLEDYKISGDKLPLSNKKYWIVLDSNDHAKIILKTVKVEFNPFNEVTSDIAIAEGEGDLSLDYWRNAHKEFFEPFLKNFGLRRLEDSTVVTEYFELVFKK